jgi:hypothetical protein
MWFSKKDDGTQGDTPAMPQEEGTNPLLATDASSDAPAPDDTEITPTVLFSDKLPEELEEEIAVEQANLRRIREETHEMVTEEHPEIERIDTVDKAHERGEI